jgi:hypothetical protein
MQHHLFLKVIKKASELKYRSVDILYCVLHLKSSKNNYNIFSIAIYNEMECTDNKKVPLDIRINGKYYSIFTFRQKLSTDDFHQYLSSFNGVFIESSFADSRLEFIKPSIKDLSLLDKKSLNDKFKDLFPHSIYSQYLFEIFCTDKSFFNEINNEEIRLNEYFAEIKQRLGIDISQFDDRIGNFIILIPERRITAKFYGSHTDGKVLFVETFLKDCDKKDFILLLKTVNNNEIIDSLIISEIKEKILIPDYNKDGKITIEIWDLKNKLLVLNDDGYLIKEIVINMNIIHGKRVVKQIDKNGNVKEIQVDLTSPAYSKMSKEKEFSTFISERESETKKRSLLLNKELFQYKKDQHEEALGDIINLINQNVHSHVYFWDPYFTYKDMERILPFVNDLNIDIRIISDFSALNESKEDSSYKSKSDLDFVKEIEDSIKKLKSALIENIEFRYKFGNCGFGFHDRFLIIDNDCWMLGSSFNSIGKVHSLIVKINYPEIVSKMFLDLWEKLKDNSIKLS